MSHQVPDTSLVVKDGSREGSGLSQSVRDISQADISLDGSSEGSGLYHPIPDTSPDANSIDGSKEYFKILLIKAE